MGVLPQTVKAASAIEIIDNETQQVAISISSEGVLHVTGPLGRRSTFTTLRASE